MVALHVDIDSPQYLAAELFRKTAVHYAVLFDFFMDTKFSP